MHVIRSRVQLGTYSFVLITPSLCLAAMLVNCWITELCCLQFWSLLLLMREIQGSIRIPDEPPCEGSQTKFPHRLMECVKVPTFVPSQIDGLNGRLSYHRGLKTTDSRQSSLFGYLLMKQITHNSRIQYFLPNKESSLDFTTQNLGKFLQSL